MNYSNSDNFLSTVFGISIKKNVLKLKTGELNLNKNVNMKKSLINKDTNLNGIHKFTNKRRLRTKNDFSNELEHSKLPNSIKKNKESITSMNSIIRKKF